MTEELLEASREARAVEHPKTPRKRLFSSASHNFFVLYSVLFFGVIPIVELPHNVWREPELWLTIVRFVYKYATGRRWNGYRETDEKVSWLGGADSLGVEAS